MVVEASKVPAYVMLYSLESGRTQLWSVHGLPSSATRNGYLQINHDVIRGRER